MMWISGHFGGRNFVDRGWGGEGEIALSMTVKGNNVESPWNGRRLSLTEGNHNRLRVRPYHQGYNT